MSNGSQGLAYFPGIKQILGWNFTLNHGIYPSVAQFEIAPQESLGTRFGDMEWGDGTETFKMKSCIVDAASLVMDTNSFVLRFSVMDRRWKWRFGNNLQGFYNIRRGSAAIVEGTEKTPEELAKLCLDAMGEKRYETKALAAVSTVRPLVEWDYTNPAVALQEMTAQLGFRVVLKLDDSVAICREGDGATPPGARHPQAKAVSATLNPPETPDKVVVVSAPERWQVDLTLEAVGIDPDGQIKPIDKLKYKPEGGWGIADIPHFNAIQNKKDRERAMSSVYRWYRVSGIKGETAVRFGGGQGSGKKGVAEKPTKHVNLQQPSDLVRLDQILPLYSEQCEDVAPDDMPPERVNKESKVSKPPVVYGVWYNWHTATDEVLNTTTKLKALKKEDDEYGKSVICESGWSLDTESGIVKFSQPIFKLNRANNAPTGAIELKPAELILRTSISFRDKVTRAFRRYTKEKEVPDGKGGTQPLYIIRDDVPVKVVLKYSDDFTVTDKGTNSKAADKELNYYLDNKLKEFLDETPMTADYIGFFKMDLDGAIQSVTWNTGNSGYYTRVQRNNDTTVYAPTWREQRYNQQLQQAVEQAVKNPSVKARDAARLPVK